MPSQGVFVPAQLNDLSVDVQLSGAAQGDLLYRGASKWNNLPAGSASALLRSGGAGASPAWAANGSLTAGGQLQLSAQGSGGGLLLGGDVQLYRSAANIGLFLGDLEVRPAGATPSLKIQAGTDPSSTVLLGTNSNAYGMQFGPTNGATETVVQMLGQTWSTAGQRGECGVYLGSDGYFRVITRGGSETLRVTRANLVGIGTDAPDSKLTLQGGAFGLASSNTSQVGLDYGSDALRVLANTGSGLSVVRQRVQRADGRFFFSVPNSAPTDSDIWAAGVSVWVDETNHKLVFRVRYADGTTYKTGEVALS